MTDDSTWVYGYNPETRQQVILWKSISFPCPGKANLFSDIHEFWHHECTNSHISYVQEDVQLNQLRYSAPSVLHTFGDLMM
jgi:hypothetical protein